MEVFVCKGFSGQIYRVKIDPEQPVGRQLPQILEQMQFVVPDLERLGIYNLTQDFEYVREKSFTEQRTCECDLLLIADGSVCHK